jgi:hypothetical protein
VTSPEPGRGAVALEAIDRDIWLAEGPEVRFLGAFPYPTRMAVVRLGNGDLWVWSPIPLDDALTRELAALGPVRHLVSPNKLHHLFLAPWAAAHFGARLYASPGLAAKRRDLTFHAELGDEPDPAWAQDIDQVIFRGSLFMEEVVFFHRASRTAIFTDLIQRFDPGSALGWRGALMRLDGLVGEAGSTPREWRLSFFKRRAAREARDKVLAWNPRRLVVAHGHCASEGAREIVERALSWLGHAGPRPTA